MSTWAVIVAAGISERFGEDLPKQFHEVCGRPLLSWTIDRFERADTIDDVLLVVAEEYQIFTTQNVVDRFGFYKVSKVVAGGKSRQESVLKGLLALPESTKLVAIHDGARPLTCPADIDRVVKAGKASKAAILATPASDTVKRVKVGCVNATLDRKEIWLAQTPQVFDYKRILQAHQNHAGAGEAAGVTDDSSLVEKMGMSVKVIQATTPNIKVTTAEDLKLVRTLLTEERDV